MKVKIDFLSPAVNAVSSSNLNGSIEILSPAVSINKSFVLNAEIKSATQAYCELVADAAASMPEVIAASKKIESLLITDTASGPIASFPDGAEMPLKSLVVDINPVQAGSGDPSPQNIRPITGHTGADVTAAGKNLLPLTVYVGVAYNPTVGATFSTTQHGTQWTDNHDGTFTINTSATWQNYGIFMPVRNGHSYFRQFTFTSTGQGGFSEGYLDGDFKVLSKSNVTTMPTTKSAGLSWSIYPTAKYYYVVFTNRGTASATLTLTNPIVSSGTSAVTYEPYNATTKAVTWQDSAGTVYGGTLDVVSGSVEKTMEIVDLGDLTWAYNNSGFFQAPLQNVAVGTYTGIPNALCSNYATGSIASVRDGSMTGISVNSTGYVYVRDPAYNDAATFKAAMNGVQLCYELATPTDFSTTPVTDLVSQYGDNNVWNDCGDTTVEYVADPKLYINKIVAALA